MMDIPNRTARQRIESIVRTFVKGIAADREIAPAKDLSRDPCQERGAGRRPLYSESVRIRM